jgi:predicted nucleic acid-binding protein
MPGAWEVYDQCRADERIAFLPERDGLDPKLRALARGHQSSPNVWADAYLAAFASTAGLRLVTFDKALGSRSDRCLVLK